MPRKLLSPEPQKGQPLLRQRKRRSMLAGVDEHDVESTCHGCPIYMSCYNQILAMSASSTRAKCPSKHGCLCSLSSFTCHGKNMRAHSPSKPLQSCIRSYCTARMPPSWVPSASSSRKTQPCGPTTVDKILCRNCYAMMYTRLASSARPPPVVPPAALVGVPH